MSLLEYVKARVVEEGDCWIWQQYAKNQPQMQKNGKSSSVRRALWEEVNKKTVPKGRLVVVKCGDKRCCNPTHIQTAEVSAIRKKAAKKRGASFAVKVAIGKRKQAGKMTEEMLHHIRTSNESSQQLATKYGLSKTTVKNVRNGTTWKDYTVMGLVR